MSLPKYRVTFHTEYGPKSEDIEARNAAQALIIASEYRCVKLAHGCPKVEIEPTK